MTNPGAQTNTEGDSVNLALGASDSDGDTLSYSATGLPAGLSINSGTGVIAGTVTTEGSYSATVSVNDGNGGSDSASFAWTVNGNTGSCGGLVQEAEDGTRFGNFTVGNDGAASGGQYVHVPDNDTFANFGSNNRVEFCMTVTTAGSYRIQGWVYGASGRSDSFYVTMDGQPNGGYLWDVLPNTSYAADYVSNRGGADPVQIAPGGGRPHHRDLSAGRWHAAGPHCAGSGDRWGESAPEPHQPRQSGQHRRG